MSDQVFEMNLSDIPEYLIAEIAGVINSYSTALIKIKTNDIKNERPILIGSGTFVTIQGIQGILTAHHVAHQLEFGCLLGLILISNEHRHIIEFQHLEIIDIAKGTNDSDGPDLSFIVLPLKKVSEIKPYKHFIDLATDREVILYDPPEVHGGIWFLCGALDEKTRVGKSSRGSSPVLSLEGTCSPIGVHRFYTKDGFDYIEADVEYDKGLNLPSTFGGMSGGSLWQVTITKNSDGKFETGRYFLSGVAFYQSEIKASKRFIKCHGRESLYKNVYSKVANKES